MFSINLTVFQNTKLNIKLKLAYAATILALLTFIFLFLYIGIENRRNAFEDSKLLAKEISRKAALETEVYLSSALMSARSLEQRAKIIKRLGGERQEIIYMLLEAVKRNPNVLSAWTLWEPDAFDGKDSRYMNDSMHNENGILGVGFFRDGDMIKTEISTPLDYDEPYYVIPASIKTEVLLEPYLYVYHQDKTVFFETSVIVPFIENSNFYGVFGIDLDLRNLQTKINQVKLYQSGYLSLISNQGIIVSHPDSGLIQKDFFTSFGIKDSAVVQAIHKGQEYSGEVKSNYSGKRVFRFFYPIRIRNLANPWSMMVEIPVEEAAVRSEQSLYVALGTLILGISLIIYLIYNIRDRRKFEKDILGALAKVNESNRIISENERNYREIFNSTNEAIFIHETETGKILDVNDVMLTMFGYQEKEQVLSLSTGELSLNEKPYSNEDAIQYITKAINEGPQVFEWLSRKKNDQTFWTEVSLRQAVINGKNRILAVIRDISERKQAEKALRESEEKHRHLMENLNEVVMMVDHDDKILYVNRMFTEKLGYAYEEIVGRTGYEVLVSKEDRKVIISANKDREQRKSGQYEISFISKSGKLIDFLVSGAPVFDSEGNITGSIGAMIDITERKAIEKELQKYRNHLELIVKERTDELGATNEELMMSNEELMAQREELETTLENLHKAQNRLIQAEKMASLGVLAAGVAHEINNPLNFINGGITGLETYFSDHLKDHYPKVATLLDGIQTGVNRAAAIVTSLSHYSRRDDLPLVECNIHSIIDNCLIMIHNQIKNRIEVVKDFCHESVIIHGNEGKLHQAILNIIANSAQAIENRGTIEISTKTENQQLKVIITDDGCGIDSDILPKIMDPFFTTKAPGKGTGLGLSITYNIIKEHGGNIEFSSVKGSGTTVEITLPMK